MTKEERKNIIKSLSSKRFTYKYIGNLFGLSKQRVHQILKDYSSIPKPPLTIIPKDWVPKDCSEIKVRDTSISGGRDKLREKVRIRDNHTCQICNRIWKKGERRLDVHHLDECLEGKIGNLYKNNLNSERMITLCHKCHLRLDVVRKKKRDKNIDILD